MITSRLPNLSRLKKAFFILRIIVFVISPCFCNAASFSLQALATAADVSILKDTSGADSLKYVVKIARSWDLPPALDNISDFVFVDENRIACILNVAGTIYIYNALTKTIEREIPFAPPGNYKSIVMIDETAFVACADGRIYEIQHYGAAKPVVKEYGTHLTIRQNVAGLCYDDRNKRILVALKGIDNGNQFYKGIYSFELKTRTMPVKPVLKINLQDSILQKTSIRKLQLSVQPSGIDIHPISNEIYIIDGMKSQMLILDESGKIKSLYNISKNEVVRPEGVRFTPSGDLYIISSGSKREVSRLMMVTLESYK